MMSCVVDVYPWRNAPQSLSHPAGLSLPLEKPEHADFLIPQLRRAISTGRYCADLISGLPFAVRPGERVLVIGSGLGVVSTLAAKCPGVEKVIAMEPNIPLADYIGAVHRLNGVPWVETVNAVPTQGGNGRVPLFVRHDVRASSLVPDDGPWRQVMLVPGVDLNLILAEEGVSRVVVESSIIPTEVAAQVRLGSSVRMLVGLAQAGEEPFEDGGLAQMLAAQAPSVERFGAALMFCGTECDRVEADRIARAR